MTNSTTVDEVVGGAPFSFVATRQVRMSGSPCYRIALLTPYTGGNLGDAAIQDAVIANLRLRLPGAKFSGISLNCDNFVEQHGIDGFPLCGSSTRFYGMCVGRVAGQPGFAESSPEKPEQKGLSAGLIKKTLKESLCLGGS